MINGRESSGGWHPPSNSWWWENKTIDCQFLEFAMLLRWGQQKRSGGEGDEANKKNSLADCLCQKRAKGPYLEKSFSFFLFPPSALHLPTLAVAEFRGLRRGDSVGGRAQTLLTPSPLASLYCLASSLIFQRHLHRSSSSSSSTSTSVAATAARRGGWQLSSSLRRSGRIVPHFPVKNVYSQVFNLRVHILNFQLQLSPPSWGSSFVATLFPLDVERSLLFPPPPFSAS